MTRPQRWNKRLEGQRGGAESAARQADEELEAAEHALADANALLLNNPDLARLKIAQALTRIARSRGRQERIIRLMAEAAAGLGDYE